MKSAIGRPNVPVLCASILLGAVRVLAAEEPQEIPLWPGGAPGFESRRHEPIQARDWWMRNIHNPSITVFLPPKDKATGAAVLVLPGGGHRDLVFDAEGRDPAVFLSSIGVAAFALKYRLAREKDSPYSIETHAPQDAHRAMRLIRSRAQEWNIDPHRLGMLGFSAGGEVVSLVAYGSGEGDPKASDPIDRRNGKPDFQMLIYPGPIGIPDVVPGDAPPAFLLAANADACCSETILRLLERYRAAKRPVEAHFFGHDDHAFNMGGRSPFRAVRSWPQRMADWLADSGLLAPPEHD